MSLYSSNTTLPRSSVPVGPPLIATSKYTRGFASFRRTCLTLGILGTIRNRRWHKSAGDRTGALLGALQHKTLPVSYSCYLLIGLTVAKASLFVTYAAAIITFLSQTLHDSKSVCDQVSWQIVELITRRCYEVDCTVHRQQNSEQSEERYYVEFHRSSSVPKGNLSVDIGGQVVSRHFKGLTIVRKSIRPTLQHAILIYKQIIYKQSLLSNSKHSLRISGDHHICLHKITSDYPEHCSMHCAQQVHARRYCKGDKLDHMVV